MKKIWMLLTLLPSLALAQISNITLAPSGQVAYNYAFLQNNTHTSTTAFVKTITVASGGCIAAGAYRTGALGSSGGSGYNAGDKGTIGSGGAVYTVSTAPGGVVATFTVAAPFGSGYTVTNGVSTSATTGTGSGFLVNVTGIYNGTAGPNCATVTTNTTALFAGCTNATCTNGDSFTLTGAGVFNGTYTGDLINYPTTFNYQVDTSQSTSASYSNSRTNDSLSFITNDQAGNVWSFYREGTSDATDAGVVMVRKSTNNGSTWTTPAVLFQDSTTACNGSTTACDFRNLAGGTAANGVLYLWYTRYNWSPAGTLGIYYATCQPNSVDCTLTANWSSPTQFTSGLTWCSTYTPGFTMPNGEIGIGLAAQSSGACTTQNQYIAVSCDNASTWNTGTSCTGSPTTLIHVTDSGDSFAVLPTNETAFLWLGGNTLIGFGRNNLATYSPPGTISCSTCGQLIFMSSADLGATWHIVKTGLTSIQPQGSMSQWNQVSPILLQPNLGGPVTLMWGERDIVSGPGYHSYIEALTFNPQNAIANPTTFATTGQVVPIFGPMSISADMGYPGAVAVSSGSMLVQWDSQQYGGGPLNLFTNTSTFTQPGTAIKGGLAGYGIAIQ